MSCITFIWCVFLVDSKPVSKNLILRFVNDQTFELFMLMALEVLTFPSAAVLTPTAESFIKILSMTLLH